MRVGGWCAGGRLVCGWEVGVRVGGWCAGGRLVCGWEVGVHKRIGGGIKEGGMVVVLIMVVGVLEEVVRMEN